MKKKIISIALATVLALSLAIFVSAAESESSYISSELYQAYTTLTERVSQERNIPLEICPMSEMTEVRSLDEFEADLQELCDIIVAIKSSDSSLIATRGDSQTNPSAGGAGRKSLRVNISKSMTAGYFLWTVRGTAVIQTAGPNPYNFSSATIDEISLVKRPSNAYTSRAIRNPEVFSKSASMWKVNQLMEIKKSGTAAGTFYAIANFRLDTNTGVVTMTGQAW